MNQENKLLYLGKVGRSRVIFHDISRSCFFLFRANVFYPENTLRTRWFFLLSCRCTSFACRRGSRVIEDPFVLWVYTTPLCWWGTLSVVHFYDACSHGWYITSLLLHNIRKRRKTSCIAPGIGLGRSGVSFSADSSPPCHRLAYSIWKRKKNHTWSMCVTWADSLVPSASVFAVRNQLRDVLLRAQYIIIILLYFCSMNPRKVCIEM